MEDSEPGFTDVPFNLFKRRFPEGMYRFRGVTTNGRTLVGSDQLSHLITAAPVATTPREGHWCTPLGSPSPGIP